MAIAVPYLNENSLINYPLAQDQDVPEIVRRLIVDFGITFCMPFYCTPVLKSVEISLSDVVITLGSLESLDTFATITASDLRFYSIGGHWYTARVLGDCGEEPSGAGENQYYLSPTICVVVDENVINETKADGYSWSGSLLFDPHVISYEPLRFEKLILENYQKDPIEIYPTSYRQIWFKGGHNVAIGPTDDGIVISAAPGAGEGVVPCECEEDTGNGLSGNVRVVGDGCLTVEPSPADSHKLIIRDSCVACCQCSQYVEKVDTLRGLANDLSSVGASIRSNIDKLNEEISKYNRTINCTGSEEVKRVVSGSGWNPSPIEHRSRARVYAVGVITNTTCYLTRETVTEFSIEDGVDAPGETQWIIGSDDGKSIGGSGLPNTQALRPGETMKVLRTFIMNDPSIIPMPQDKEYDTCFDKKITFRGPGWHVEFEQTCDD